LQTWMNAWGALLDADRIPTLLVLAAYALFMLVERWAPAESGHHIAGRVRNLVYLALFKTLGYLAIAAWYVFGPRLDITPSEISGASLALLVVAHLFAGDFLYYWYHRAQHRFEALWAVHELHHADRALDVTTSYRTYWLEAPIQTILIATPTLLLFGDHGRGAAIATVVTAQFFLLFSHANLRLGLGRLSTVVVGPQVHRIHHSRLAEHRDKNFAQIFPVIDWLFGTYHAPAPDEYPPTGAEGLASDAPIGRAMSQPFAIWATELGLGKRRPDAPDGVAALASQESADESTEPDRE
jgi:sterol desaturase/sphingolipid hydroxylase (fatty acid hydroxylase superfamily)